MNKRAQCFHWFIYSCKSLKVWNATAGQNRTFPIFLLLSFCLFLVVSLLLSFPFIVKRLEALEVSLSGSVYWRGRAERENFCVCPPRKRVTVPSDVTVIALRPRSGPDSPRRVDRLGGGAVCQARNSGETVNGALVPHFWRRREMSSFIKAARRLGPVVI